MKFKFFLLLGVLFTAISCQDDAQKEIDTKRSYGDSSFIATIEPRDENKEWSFFKKLNGFHALHLAIPNTFLEKNLEIKIEQFKNGKRVILPNNDSVIVLGKHNLGVVKNYIQNDSMLSFYGTKKNDSVEVFSLDGTIHAVNVELLKDVQRQNYRWVVLLKTGKQKMDDSIWLPFYALTLPYKETQTSEKCYYCVLPDLVYEYDSWGVNQGVEHYYIFSMRFVK